MSVAIAIPGRAILIVAGVLGSSLARAEPDCRESTGQGAPVVHAAVDVADPVLSRAVMDEIAAAVARDGFRVCPVGTGGKPVAVLSFTTPADAPGVSGGALQIEVRAEDLMTAKVLSRVLDLRNFPEDSRALAVAVAGTELLRASWLELALPETRPLTKPPREVARVVESDVERGGRRDRTLGLLPTFEVYDAGERLWGGDLFLSHWFGNRISWDVALGARRGLAQDSAHGQVQTSALVVWTGASVRLLRRGRWSWTASAAVVGATIKLEGLPVDGAIGRSRVGQAVIARGGTDLLIETGQRLVWRVGLGAGAPLLGVGGLDQEHRVTGVAGLELSARVGAGVRF